VCGEKGFYGGDGGCRWDGQSGCWLEIKECFADMPGKDWTILSPETFLTKICIASSTSGDVRVVGAGVDEVEEEEDMITRGGDCGFGSDSEDGECELVTPGNYGRFSRRRDIAR